MSKRTKALARDLHDRGLRKRLAARVAEQIASEKAGSAEARATAQALRRLADDVEAAGAAPSAAQDGDGAPAPTSASGPVAPATPPARLRTRPRVRRS